MLSGMLSGVKHSHFSRSSLESHTSGLDVDRVRQNRGLQGPGGRGPGMSYPAWWRSPDP